MTLKEQFFILLIMISSSFGIGILFDGYRVLFHKLRIRKWAILICDICIGVFSAFTIFQLLLWLNDGQLRLIILIAFFIGLMLYYLSLSEKVIVFWVYCFKIIYKVIKVILYLINMLLIKPLKAIFYILILFISNILKIINPLLFILKKLKILINGIFISKPKKIVNNLRKKKNKKEGFLALLKKLFKKK